MTQSNQVSVLYSAAEIKTRLELLAGELAGHFPDEMVIVALLKGSFVFAADLIRELSAVGCHPQIDFMTLSSYGKGTTGAPEIKMHRDLVEDVTGKDVLIIDDILESGRTLNFARNLLKERGAASVKIAVLLEKPGKKLVDINADYIGFTIPDKFVVGYGLDYANYYRELPYIGVVEIH